MANTPTDPIIQLALAVETLSANVAALMGVLAALPSARETDWISAKAIAARAAPTPLAPPAVPRRGLVVQVHAGVDRLKSLVDQLAAMKLGGGPKGDRP
jgi:hypothetical protein